MNKKLLIKKEQHILDCLEDNRLAEAEKHCLDLCNSCPNSPEAWAMLGSIRGRRDNQEQAIAAYECAVRLRPEYFEALYNLGCTLMGSGRNDGALEIFRKAHAVRPGAVEVMNNIGVLLRNEGELDSAIGYFRRATQMQPNYPVAWYNLGNAHLALENPEEAVVCYRKAVTINPQYAEAFLKMGNACRQMFLREVAEQCYRQAIRVSPGYDDALFALADILVLLGRHDEALGYYDRLLESDKDNLDALAGKAEALEKKGDLQQVFEFTSPYGSLKVDCPRLAMTYANLCSRFDVCRDAVAWIDKLLASDETPVEQLANLHQVKGKILDKQENYRDAFHHFNKANILKKQLGEKSRHNEDINASLKYFASNGLAELPHSSVVSELPVFIVGMPRSGTSLVEQIIASHPEAYGAGELPYINRFIANLPGLIGVDKRYPECLSDINATLLDTLAQEYLGHLAKAGKDASRVTDKLPHNYMWLGFIEMLFPKARIIHCVRDPMDNCLSLFTTRGFNAHHSYVFDLEKLGEHYMKYRELMSVWKRQLALPVLDVNYEHLVSNFDTEARRFIEFCGLGWDERCLRYYDSGRVSATLSYDQVRRPIYSSSVGRWKSYEEFLGPLSAVLGRQD